MNDTEQPRMRNRDKKRISRVTTRTGDEGLTSLADGQRRSKGDPVVELSGALDEANCAIGLLACAAPDSDQDALLTTQSRLFDVGAAVAMQDADRDMWSTLTDELDEASKSLNASLEPLREFVLPGSNELNARAHLARSLVRRAERAFWNANIEKLNESGVGAYLNRLSDFLFVYARTKAETERLWKPYTEAPSDE